MKRWLIILLVPGVVLPVAAVAALLANGGQQKQPTGVATVELPDFAYSSPQAKAAYRLAVDHQELVADMPCYCGCGVLPEAPHRNLLDCFMNDDGSFDSHASGCEVCADIAVDAVRWQMEGKGPAQIRGLVDAKYQGFGLPTDTAPVAE